MKQLLQRLGQGRPFVLDVPEPILPPGFVLVRNYYSAVSAGTEGATVRSARKSLVGKALERPKEVKAVLDLFKRQGFTQTYRTVCKKLDGYSPMGYSCSGKVLQVGENVSEFAEGDLVACAGVGYANHAEIVAVPENLCVKLARGANLKAAAYNTIGAIAMQGVRQADLRLGESCVVIGLGLVGAMACQLLKASGVRAFGIDVAENAVKNAQRLGIDARLRSDAALEEDILLQTRGIGADAVLIAAGSSSLDPINFAGRLARQKGRVVVLGAVPTGFDRNPDYYPKELEIRMSCSYGPGRYDLQYEEKGCDYPPSYARWTEKRNMQAFQDLVQEGKIDVEALTTHEFTLNDAPQAYDLILDPSEFRLGLLLRYDVEKQQNAFSQYLQKDAALSDVSDSKDNEIKTKVSAPRPYVGYAFVGAGSYAQGSLLPNIPRGDRLRPICVVSRSGSTSKRVADKFKFEFASADPNDALANDRVDAVFIATRHDSHAKYVLEALDACKNVYVEKPLCITLDDFVAIRKRYLELSQSSSAPRLTVGYNRRFAPAALELKRRLSDAPVSVVYRVNAGAVPKNTWIQDKTLGGGRILGEVCHFADFASWIANSLPISVYAAAMKDGQGLADTLSVLLKYENGSIATIGYFANGAKRVPKERVEVYQSGVTGVIDDFRSVEISNGDKLVYKKSSTQDKGQRGLLRAFFDSIDSDVPSPVPEEETFRNALAAFAILESLTSGKEISLV